MHRNQTLTTVAAGLSIVFAGAGVQAEELANTVKIGYAVANFNTRSGDLSGPFTPPGIKAKLEDVDLLALSYERRLSDQWSVMFQGATPPRAHLIAAGTAAGLGQVASAKIWVPAVIATYSFTNLSGFRPYVGAGVNYTRFTDEQATYAYTNTVGGSSTSVNGKSSWGPVARLGLEYPISKNWVVDFSYLRYWIKTTVSFTTVTPTPGGNVNVVRTVDAKVNPDVFTLGVGYRF